MVSLTSVARKVRAAKDPELEGAFKLFREVFVGIQEDHGYPRSEQKHMVWARQHNDMLLVLDTMAQLASMDGGLSK